MIDYRGLHAKIKAKLRPDSPMPEGWRMGFYDRAIHPWALLLSPDGKIHLHFSWDFDTTIPRAITFLAEALGIPLEDNGYTDLVKAAELEIEITRQFHACKTSEQTETWAESANDGEIAIMEALERIKSENP